MSFNVSVRPDVLVSADWLTAHLDDPNVRVVEVDVSPKSYDEAHIPGAVLWNIYKDLKDPQYRLVNDDALERMLCASGIDPDTRVVFYGYGPALGYWLMKLHHHGDASILNLSKGRWIQDGRPMTTARPMPQPAHYAFLQSDPRLRSMQPMVAASIGASDREIVDVRSEAEYIGERFWPSGMPEERGRPGHVPGARHVPLDALLNEDGSYADADTLRATFGDAIDSDRELITYCTIGGRASVAWFALSELLGRRGVRVYDGSWAEWGFMPDVPIETVATAR